MALRLVNSSAVVVAQHFNPSVTGQYWLIQNKIVLPQELQVGAIFSDMIVQVPTRDFHLLITQESCQFTFPTPATDERRAEQQALLKERLGTLVSLLPHTPYTAIGLNYVWHLFPDSETIGSKCRQFFFLPGKPLYTIFDQGDARFGSYMSMDWGGYRLRLDARPIICVLPDAPQTEVIQFVFNYHRNLAGTPNPSSGIIDALNQWNVTWKNSLSIMETILGSK